MILSVVFIILYIYNTQFKDKSGTDPKSKSKFKSKSKSKKNSEFDMRCEFNDLQNYHDSLASQLSQPRGDV